jgi:hypothetical protein
MLASRDGLYTSFFYPITVIVVSIFVGANGIKNIKISILLPSILAILSALKFAYLVELQSWMKSYGPTTIQTLQIIGIVLVTMVILIRANRWLTALVIAFLIMACVNWEFNGDSKVYQNNLFVSKLINEKLPYFFYDKSAPGGVEFDSLVASFTEKAWWKTGLKYPDCRQLVGGELIVPGSSVILLVRDARYMTSYSDFKDCIGAKGNPKVFNLEDRFGNFQMHVFETKLNQGKLNLVFDAEDLPGIVGELISGNRTANEVAHEKGVLSFGPYVALPKGKYKVSFEYSSDTTLNSWIIQSGYDGGIYTLLSGKFLNTSGKVDKLETYLELPKNSEARYQFLTFFEGEGKFTFLSLEVVKID